MTLAVMMGAWLSVCTPPAMSAPAVIVGEARGADDNVVYCEWYTDRDEQQHQQVIYADTGGEVIARKSLTFEPSLATPQFEQVNVITGEKREARFDAVTGRWQLSYRAHQQASLQMASIPRDEISVIDAGFVGAVQLHWASLQAGEKVTVEFGSTVFQKALALRVKRVSPGQCSLALGSGEQCIWVEAGNFLVRLFVARLELAFDRSKQLTQFKGVVNIQTAQGETQSLHIRYHYFSPDGH